MRYRDAHQVLTAAAAAGAKVILVGDHRQLPEVNAGGVFRAAVEQAGPAAAELTVNRRQQAAWEHQALDELRHGNAAAGFASYQAHDHVTIADTVSQSHSAALDGWLDAYRAGVDVVLLAGTRAEAKTLNQLARLRVADRLHGPTVTVHGRSFQAGDRVVLLHNDGHGHTDLDTGESVRVDNGMLATITHIDPDDRLDICLTNGRRIQVDAGYLHQGHVDHGYATTVHKAQELTCDQVHVVGPAGLYREAVYVAMSRARQGAYIYATSQQIAEFVEQAHTAGIPLPAEHPGEPDHQLRQAVGQSRAKQFAHSHDPHLQAVADLADHHAIDVLQARYDHLRSVARFLTRVGIIDPSNDKTRATDARRTRSLLASGVRVNAADWDNIGTVIAVNDQAGTARACQIFCVRRIFHSNI